MHIAILMLEFGSFKEKHDAFVELSNDTVAYR